MMKVLPEYNIIIASEYLYSQSVTKERRGRGGFTSDDKSEEEEVSNSSARLGGREFFDIQYGVSRLVGCHMDSCTHNHGRGRNRGGI